MSKVTLAISVATIVYSSTTAFQSVAADYPERPVRVIVASSQGSAADVSMRIIAAELTRQMGKQFVVDNRSGASRSIGTEMIAHATPDGYIIGNGNTVSLAIDPSILLNLPYDSDRDIQPIAQYSIAPFILAVTLSLPVKSVQELIAHARKNPGKLLFVSLGNSSPHYLAGELLKRMIGTQMTHVLYKGGQQVISVLTEGQVHLMFHVSSLIGA